MHVSCPFKALLSVAPPSIALTQLHREQATGALDLGESARFYPTDAALARWRAGAHGGRAVVVYD